MDYNVYNLAHLKDLSDGDLALQLDTMADLFDEHPAYNGKTLPPWIIGPTHLRAHSVDLRHLSPAAKHDESKEAERLLVRERGVQAITFSSQYVVMYAAHENDPTLLENIGLEQRTRSFTKEGPRKPEKRPKLLVKHTKNVSGSISASDIFHSCRMRAGGLTPTKRCYFRARLQNDAGKGPWSEIVELIIL